MIISKTLACNIAFFMVMGLLNTLAFAAEPGSSMDIAIDKDDVSLGKKEYAPYRNGPSLHKFGIHHNEF